MIQLLPSSYNQRRTVQLNYEVLAHMFHDRKDHKLDEWWGFCETIKAMPYAEDLIVVFTPTGIKEQNIDISHVDDKGIVIINGITYELTPKHNV